MNTFEFTFVVDHRLSEDEVDGLFDRADDVTPEREQARTLLGFDRQATSLADALVSALRDVEAAGLTVGSVRSEDLVTLKEIAARTGRSYETCGCWPPENAAPEGSLARCPPPDGPSTAGRRCGLGSPCMPPPPQLTRTRSRSSTTGSSPRPTTSCAPVP